MYRVHCTAAAGGLIKYTTAYEGREFFGARHRSHAAAFYGRGVGCVQWVGSDASCYCLQALHRQLRERCHVGE